MATLLSMEAYTNGTTNGHSNGHANGHTNGHAKIIAKTPTLSSNQIFNLVDKYAAHDYKPIPVAIARGKDIFVWDVEGKKYYDFLSGYAGTAIKVSNTNVY